MKDYHTDIGCGLWLIALFVALFAAEWLLLNALFQVVPRERWLLLTTGIIIVTIAGGWIAVYRRVQRKG